MATRVMRSVRGLGRRDALQGARGVLGACDAVVSRRRRRAACRVRRPPRLAAYSLKLCLATSCSIKSDEGPMQHEPGVSRRLPVGSCSCDVRDEQRMQWPIRTAALSRIRFITRRMRTQRPSAACSSGRTRLQLAEDEGNSLMICLFASGDSIARKFPLSAGAYCTRLVACIGRRL